jgi:hypothetical protein
MLLVHVLDEAAGRVVVVTVQDARTSSAATNGRGDGSLGGPPSSARTEEPAP